MGKFNVTFEIVTEESAEFGDVHARGFVLEDVSLSEAIRALGGCANEADSSPISLKNPPRWFTHYDYALRQSNYLDPKDPRAWYGVESRSLHLPRDITPSSALRIARLLGVNP